MSLHSFRNDQTGYRRVFFAAHGGGPWPCFHPDCNELVTEYGGNGGRNLVVHHVDEDQSNNAPSNLVAMHWPCHTKLHRTGKTPSEETLIKLSAHQKGKPKSRAHRAAISAGLRGTTKSEVARAKMRAAKLGKTLSAAHVASMSDALKGRAFTPEHCANISAAQRGKTLSTEHREKLSVAKLGKLHARQPCAHCGRMTSERHLARHERACTHNPEATT